MGENRGMKAKKGLRLGERKDVRAIYMELDSKSPDDDSGQGTCPLLLES